MTDPTGQQDARAGLAKVRAAQDAVIDRAAVPSGYWWGVAVLTVGLGLVVDWGAAVAVAWGSVLFALLVAAATAWAIVGGGRMQVSQELLGTDVAVRIVGFVGVLVGASLALGFALRAVGVSHPATLTTVGTAIGLVVGGPLLMRSLRRSMLRHREAG